MEAQKDQDAEGKNPDATEEIKRESPEIAEARAEAAEEVGEWLRWIREAFEVREPRRHSLSQWAKSLQLTPAMLSRIENGKTQPPLHILQRIIYYSGVSPGFVLFGVIGDGYMDQWLTQYLLQTHGDSLVEFAKFRADRAMTQRSVGALEARKPRTGRPRRRPLAP